MGLSSQRFHSTLFVTVLDITMQQAASFESRAIFVHHNSSDGRDSPHFEPTLESTLPTQEPPYHGQDPLVEVQTDSYPVSPLSRAIFCDANATIDFPGSSAHMRSNEDVEWA
jgi:hypothetical protein